MVMMVAHWGLGFLINIPALKTSGVADVVRSITARHGTVDGADARHAEAACYCPAVALAVFRVFPDADESPGVVRGCFLAMNTFVGSCTAGYGVMAFGVFAEAALGDNSNPSHTTPEAL